jgi:hypothetical protein
MRKRVTVTTEVDANEFFSSVLGSAFEHWDWWHLVKYDEGYEWHTHPDDMDTPFLAVGILDPDDEDEEETITKILSLADILTAYNKCDGLRWDNLDAGSSDTIMQTAMFGEPVYG